MITRIVEYESNEYFEIFCPECNEFIELGDCLFNGEEVLCLIHNNSERLGLKKDMPNEYL
jgi:hypothetical protein